MSSDVEQHILHLLTAFQNMHLCGEKQGCLLSNLGLPQEFIGSGFRGSMHIELGGPQRGNVSSTYCLHSRSSSLGVLNHFMECEFG